MLGRDGLDFLRTDVPAPKRLKQHVQGVWLVPQNCRRAQKFFPKHAARLLVHSAAKVVTELKGVFDAHLRIGRQLKPRLAIALGLAPR